MKAVRVLSLLAATFALAGCAHNVVVAPNLVSASAVLQNQVVAVPVTVAYDADPAVLDAPIRPQGVNCYGDRYDVAGAQAFHQAFDSVNQRSFLQLENSGGDYRVLIKLVSFDASLHFTPGFWTPTANAEADVAVDVAVTNANGRELTRKTIEGKGSVEMDGGCKIGGQALGDAVGRALKHAAEAYADRVIDPALFK